jgi:MFS-type transporter involved in bile tolerance (Atg22 family)
MINKIIGLYVITDDILKAIGHQDDCRRMMTDAEILTTAFTAALFFNGNQALARQYLAETGLIPAYVG